MCYQLVSDQWSSLQPKLKQHNHSSAAKSEACPPAHTEARYHTCTGTSRAGRGGPLDVLVLDVVRIDLCDLSSFSLLLLKSDEKNEKKKKNRQEVAFYLHGINVECHAPF